MAANKLKPFTVFACFQRISRILKPAFRVAFITAFALTFATIFISENATGKMKKVTLDNKKLKKDELAVFQNGKYEIVKMQEYEKVKYSAKCFKDSKTPKCDAFKALSKPEAKIQAKFEGNPAAQQCTQMGGTNLIGLDREKREYNLCYFPDMSYGVSWSMFYKINDKPVIK